MPREGSATQRGYGAAHRRLRAQWASQVETGGVTCWRCERPIGPREPWDLGHDDADRTRYRGPEHQGCNRAVHSAERRDPAPHTSAWWTR